MITTNDIINIVKDLPDDRKNPMQDTSCVYTGLDGSHCIAGEILSRLGLNVPGFGDSFNTVGVLKLIETRLHGTIDHEAVYLLNRMQRVADYATRHNASDAWRYGKMAALDRSKSVETIRREVYHAQAGAA